MTPADLGFLTLNTLTQGRIRTMQKIIANTGLSGALKQDWFNELDGLVVGIVDVLEMYDNQIKEHKAKTEQLITSKALLENPQQLLDITEKVTDHMNKAAELMALVVNVRQLQQLCLHDPATQGGNA